MFASHRIALVGGIAVGKSLVARHLESLGWTLVDADKLAHSLYASGTPLQENIVEVFGSSILTPDRQIDRRALGAIVFGNSSALAQLEALVHPPLRQALWERMDKADAAQEPIVVEMALLYRWPELVRRFDFVLGISAPLALRIQRLAERNSLSPEDARLRVEFQPPEATLLAPCTSVFSNAGAPAQLLAEVEAKLREGEVFPQDRLKRSPK